MDPDLISRRGIAEKKRPRAVDAVPHAKKLRSNIPRRKRVPSFPMVGVTLRSYFRSEDEAESSSSCFNNEISNSISVKFNGHGRKLPRSSSDARVTKSIRSFHTDSSADHFQPITKFYTKRKKESRSKEFMVGMKEFMVGTGGVVPFSESAALTKRSEPAESDGTAIAISGVSEISATLPRDSLKTGKDSSDSKLKVLELSESSCLLPPGDSEANDLIIQDNSTAEVSRIQFKSETTKPAEEAHDHDLESDLACPEQLFDRDGSSDYSACNDTTLSDFESDLFDGIYDGVSSEVSLSDLIESPEDFSERSRDNYTPSVAFSLLHQLYEQFNPSSNHSGINPKFEVVDELSEQFVFVRFPDIDDEESYQMFRSRERSEVALHDYSYGYHTTTKYGDLIVGQRLEMVNWMMEHCQGREDHDETIFLGVNLMDRFLSRGYFQTTRNLQLLGIACVTLAARIEENQPFNKSVRKKSFKVGKNSYKRCEVVSMEWLVLEVLSFQCSLPTTHSFLWFYMKAARAGPDVQDLCRHLAIMTLFNHRILRFWPSTVAAGLVILACLVTNNVSFCDVVLEIHLRSKTDDLPECIQCLEWLVEHAKLRSGNGN